MAAVFPDVSSALFYAGPVFSIALQLSNAQTAARIYSAKSVGSLSPVPFACLFANSLIWLYYGLLKEDFVVYGPNITGAVIGVGCICAYEAMSPTFNRSVYGALVLVCLFVTGLAFCEKAEEIGLVGCLGTILLMGAPLATLSNVIKERSTASIPFNQSLMSFFNSLSWAMYGALVANDIMIWAPSAIGVALASLQLSLFLVYGFPTKSISSNRLSGGALDSKV
eukprot:gene21987-24928_t